MSWRTENCSIVNLKKRDLQRMNSLEIIVRMNKRKLIENYIAKTLYRLPLEMQLEMIEFQVLNDLQYMRIHILRKLSICNLTEKRVA